MSGISPCKGCPDRYPGCHGSCEKYKEWSDLYHAEKAHLEKARTRFYTPWTASKESAIRNNIRYASVVRKKGGDQ